MRGSPRHSGSARRLLTRSIVLFMVAGLVTVTAIGAVSFSIFRRLSLDDARRNARELALADSRSLEPYFTDALADGDLAARQALDAAVRARTLTSRVVRVKVWTAEGTIVYSDASSLIGRSFEIEEDELESLRTGVARAELSDLSREENIEEQAFDPVFEVFIGVKTPSGRPMLFELYTPFDAVTADGQRTLRQFAPALLGGLVLLWLAQLPLAVALSRRLRAADERERELLTRAIESSAQERRRIASDLHDSVVQGLAGTAFSLAGMAADVRADRAADVPGALENHATALRQVVRELRSMVVSIAPAGASGHGFAPSLHDLASVVRSRGIDVDVSVDVPTETTLPPDVQALLFRTAQEALRNLMQHAKATSATLSVVADERRARLTVSDDGIGFDDATLARRRAEGHVGLRLSEELARDCGGTLAITTAPGKGTTIVLDLPIAGG